MGIHLRLDPDEPGFIIGGILCRLLHRRLIFSFDVDIDVFVLLLLLLLLKVSGRYAGSNNSVSSPFTSLVFTVR